MAKSTLFIGKFEEDLHTSMVFRGVLIVLYIFNHHINQTPKIYNLPAIILPTGPGPPYQKMQLVQQLSQYPLYQQSQTRPSIQEWQRAHSIKNITHFCYNSYCQPTVFEREKLRLPEL
jgi:hypothetical protein